MVSALADAVLPLIRTRADLHWRSRASDHGAQMHRAIDRLEAAIPTGDPREVYSVTHRALASAITVIKRADDSDGIVGGACRRLLALHPVTAAAAHVPPGQLVDWMMKFQLDGEVDYFEIDPVAYAPALGEEGMARYRARLTKVRDRLGLPDDIDPFGVGRTHEAWVLFWNDQRLAVLDRDVEAIIRTHARDRKVAAWLEDTARAFEEIGEIDLAIDWARQAADHTPGHQALKAAGYWCELLREHRPSEELAARQLVFSRWPSSSTAGALHTSAVSQGGWDAMRDGVMEVLAKRPDDVVLFALLGLEDAPLAWELATTLAPLSSRTWEAVVKVYEKVDPLAVLPIHQELVEGDLVQAGAVHYRRAARRLARMRRIAVRSEEATASVDTFIVELRETHRRRPRLQTEFNRAGLP